MNRREQALLVGLAAVITRWQQPRTDDSWQDPWLCRHEIEARQLAAKDCARIDLEAFLGCPQSPSDRTLASRAWKVLETAGYVLRLPLPYGTRNAILQLLPAGRAEVDRLTSLRDSDSVTLPVGSTDQQPVEGPETGGTTEGTSNG